MLYNKTVYDRKQIEQFYISLIKIHMLVANNSSTTILFGFEPNF